MAVKNNIHNNDTKIGGIKNATYEEKSILYTFIKCLTEKNIYIHIYPYVFHNTYRQKRRKRNLSSFKEKILLNDIRYFW